jgi:hypothetical protein
VVAHTRQTLLFFFFLIWLHFTNWQWNTKYLFYGLMTQMMPAELEWIWNKHLDRTHRVCPVICLEQLWQTMNNNVKYLVLLQDVNTSHKDCCFRQLAQYHLCHYRQFSVITFGKISRISPTPEQVCKGS